MDTGIPLFISEIQLQLHYNACIYWILTVVSYCICDKAFTRLNIQPDYQI